MKHFNINTNVDNNNNNNNNNNNVDNNNKTNDDDDTYDAKISDKSTILEWYLVDWEIQ